MPHDHNLRIVVVQGSPLADATARGPGDSLDIAIGTGIVVAGTSTGTQASRVLRLFARSYHCVTKKVLSGHSVLAEEVPWLDREPDVLRLMAGTGLHIAIAFAHHQTFKVESA